VDRFSRSRAPEPGEDGRRGSDVDQQVAVARSAPGGPARGRAPQQMHDAGLTAGAALTAPPAREAASSG
jgi:hypothetical protein